MRPNDDVFTVTVGGGAAAAAADPATSAAQAKDAATSRRRIPFSPAKAQGVTFSLRSFCNGIASTTTKGGGVPRPP